MSSRLLTVGCCFGKRERKHQKGAVLRKMPVNDGTVVPTSFLGRISARTSLLSTRDYKTTVQLLDDKETICQEFKKTSNAQVILDYICECLNIIEKDYFGLRYQDFSKHRVYRNKYWMDLNKQICKQVRGPNVALRFRVRFYPSDVGVLKEEITRYMLFVQLQRDLLHGRLYCPQNEAAVLGALALQSVIGDYDAEKRPKDYVATYRLLLKQTEKLEEKIAEAHKQFKGLTPAEAEMEFLKRASKLDTYGFDPYTVMVHSYLNEHKKWFFKDKNKQTMYIGVTYRGIYIYHVSRMIHHITWEDLEKVDYIGKEFILTPKPSYVSPYSSSSEDFEHAGDTMRSNFSSKNGPVKPHKTKIVLKFYCPSAIFAKHLWQHILSQQAFFTENDAKRIKPKFSKPRIPLLTRGSTFHFPTSRVLHEIEMEGPGERNGPQPKFTRYPLQHQAPRQHFYNIRSKYNSHSVSTVPEKVDEVMPEDVQDGQAVKITLDTAAVNEMEDKLPTVEISKTPISTKITTPENVTTFTIHLVRRESLSSIPCETSSSAVQSQCKDSFGETVNALEPVCTNTPTGNPGTIFATANMTKKDVGESGDEHPEKSERAWSTTASTTDQTKTSMRNRNAVSTTVTSIAKIFFFLLLLWLLLTAVVIALFEHDSPWLNSIPALDSVRHFLYEPLRHHISVLFTRLERHMNI